MRPALALRVIAITIAVAAAFDPAIDRSTTESEPLTVVSAGNGSRADALRLVGALPAKAEFAETTEASGAAACPSTGACVLVSDGAVPERITAGAKVLAVVDARRAGEPVVTGFERPSITHRDAASTIRIHTRQPVKQIQVFDGSALVGSADPAGKTTVDVTWVPVSAGARALRVVADDEVVHVGARVEDTPTAVMFYEPQATWLGTFVRRTLEDDPRFSVRTRARVAPPVTIASGDTGPLSASSLQRVSTVVVTAPETLTAGEVDVLERFVAVGGGSLVMLPDQRPTGASLRLLPRVTGERREPAAQAVGVLRASEWLTFDAPLGTAALASIGEGPVIVSRALGRGHVLASGALDAWKYREAGSGFDSFWTSLVWDAATLAGPELAITTDEVVARPGQTVSVHVQFRSAAVGQEHVASGVVSCGADRALLRLWPSARPGAFSGELRAQSTGECLITVTVDGLTATAPIAIQSDVQRLAADAASLEAVAAAHGALLVPAADLDAVSERIANAVQRQAAYETWHPMRSPYWLLPFVFCLSGKWFLRRRSGLS